MSLWYQPLYTAWPKAKIALIWQAPGRLAQDCMIPRNDKSWENLRQWMGITHTEFYDSNTIAILPMDFYYPGKGQHGDLSPRKNFAERWHPQFLSLMPDISLFILIWSYAQQYYLGKKIKKSLTQTVQSYQEYLPTYFPIIHPSPRNFHRHKKNPWFLEEVIPVLQNHISKIL